MREGKKKKKKRSPLVSDNMHNPSWILDSEQEGRRAGRKILASGPMLHPGFLFPKTTLLGLAVLEGCDSAGVSPKGDRRGDQGGTAGGQQG